MTGYFNDITTHLLEAMFNNSMFEIFTILFLFAIGIGIIDIVRSSLN